MNTPHEPFPIPRTGIIRDIEARLEHLQADDLDFPIVNMHGIAGMGKTVALKQLSTAVGDTYSVIWLNFARPISHDHNAIALDASPVVSLDIALKTLEEVFEELRDQLDPPEGNYELQVEYTLSQGSNAVRLLLLDGLDDLPLWRWLQESVIKPLVEEDTHTLILCASQAPLFWDFWELRDQCEPYELQPLSDAEINAFLEPYHLSAKLMGDTIKNYTQGYPLAVHTLAEQLVGSSSNSQEMIDLPGTLSDAELTVLETVGVIRLLEGDVLRTLLEQFGHPKSDVNKVMISLLAKLKSARLLREARLGQPEQLTRELRNTVRSRISQERYQQLCDALAEIYKLRAIQRPKTALYACIEWLYFATCTWQPTEQPHWTTHRKQTLLDTLSELLQRAKQANEQAIKSVHAGDLLPADASLVVLFYRDRELGAQLAAITDGGGNLYADVDKAMEGYLKNTQDLLQRKGLEADIQDLVALPLRHDFDTTCGSVLVQLAERLPTAMLPVSLQDRQNFSAAVRSFLIQPDTFDIDRLRRELNASITVSPNHIRNLFNMLNSRGLFSYDRTERTYRFNKYFKRLTSYADDRVTRLTEAKGI